MYLQLVFLALFRISSGFIPHSELDQLFHDLEGKTAEFYDVKNTEESKPIKSGETTQNEQVLIRVLKPDVLSENSKTSPTLSNHVLEDPLNGVTETANDLLYDNTLEDSYGTVEGELGDVFYNKIWEDSLGNFDEKLGELLPGEALVRKTRAAMQGMKKKCMNSTEMPEKIVGENAEQSEGKNCSCKSVPTTFPRVPAVSIFVSNVIKNIQSSELLTTVFNLTDVKAQQYSQFKYRFTIDFFRRYGYPDADLIATLLVRPIAKYFDVIPPEALMKVSVNYMADILFAEGILGAHNAEDLALKCYKKLDESAKIHEINSESGYISKYKALSEGEGGFLQSFGESSYSGLWEAAIYYAHEWLMAALDYGALKNITT